MDEEKSVMLNSQLIDEIRQFMIAKKYLGIRRMKKIPCTITERYEIPTHLIEGVPLKDQYHYKKYHGIEWLFCNGLELCRYGWFIRLEQYEYDEDWKRHDIDLYVFDWDLQLSYQSSDLDVCIEYSQYHEPYFNEKLKKMLEDRT